MHPYETHEPTPRANAEGKGMPETPPEDRQNLAERPPPVVAHHPNMSWCYRGTTASQPYGAPDAPKTYRDVVAPHPTPSPPENPHAKAPAPPKTPQTAPPHPHQATSALSSHATTTHHEHDHEPFMTYETHPTPIGNRLGAKNANNSPYQDRADTIPHTPNKGPPTIATPRADHAATPIAAGADEEECTRWYDDQPLVRGWKWPTFPPGSLLTMS